jgi:Mg-chelatase subunit ChlD
VTVAVEVGTGENRRQLLLKTPEGQTSEVPLNAEPTATQQLLRIAAAELSKPDAEPANIVYRFRGNVWRTPLPLSRPKRVTEVVVTPNRSRQASIAVRPQPPRASQVIFIFDCSGSMASENRLETARTALHNVLKDMLDAGNFRVGLRAFGRRARWTWNADLARMVPLANEQAGAAGIDPDSDAELIRAISQLDDAHHKLLNDDLAKFMPWGPTPLYLSLKESLEQDFQQNDAGDARHIVLITDGVNEQEYAKTSLQAVRGALRQRSDVKIHVVLLDEEYVLNDAGMKARLERHGTSAGREISDLKAIAAETDATYHDVNTLDELTAAFERAVDLNWFHVRTNEMLDSAQQNIPLGGTWASHVDSGKTLRAEVTILGESTPPPIAVTVEAGREVVLLYDRANNKLLFEQPQPLGDENTPAVSQPFTDRTSGRDYVATAIARRGDPPEQTVTFLVQLADTSEQNHTPRPKAVWAEIQPQGADESGAQPLFYCFDREFVLERLQPMLRFRAGNWPAMAKRAAVKLWLSFDEPIQSPARQILEISDEPYSLQIPSFPNISFEVTHAMAADETFRITILERHPDEQATPLMLTLNPAPQQIIRRRYIGLGIVRHEFDYALQDEAAHAVLEVTPSELVKAGAISVPSLDVDIGE